MALVNFVSGTTITSTWLNGIDKHVNRKTSFTATQGQTVFNLSAAPVTVLGQRIVTRNGIEQDSSDYTETVNDITFTSGLVSGDKVVVRG